MGEAGAPALTTELKKPRKTDQDSEIDAFVCRVHMYLCMTEHPKSCPVGFALEKHERPSGYAHALARWQLKADRIKHEAKELGTTPEKLLESLRRLGVKL